eukprot:gene5943-6390_t
MPRTRQQQSTLKEKAYEVIPPKYDTSLTQKAGNCIEGLPAAIFQFIQTFLSEKDYRQLMNSNLRTFQSIKYETIQYTIIGPERWYEIESIHDEKKEEFFQQFILNNVKNKSKQINFIMKQKILPKTILQYQKYFENIYSLTIIAVENITFPKKFDFNIFNNICNITLKHFHGINKIMEGFVNVVQLELESFPSLESISNINLSKTLKTLSIRKCNYLTNINIPLQDIPIVVIDCFEMNKLDDLGGQKHLTFSSSREIARSTLQALSGLIATSLESITLNCRFPFNYNDFHVFQNLSKVNINNIQGKPNHSFPIFNGTNLSIANFDISAWNQASLNTFKNLRYLKLSRCRGLIDFPVMSQLKELHLDYCYDLQHIPSLRKLRTLNLRNSSELVTINPLQPCLLTVELVAASKLSHVSFETEDGTTTVQSLQISYCPLLVSDSSWNNIPTVNIK